MNAAEKKMVDLLRDLRENYNLVGIKHEFEAEGSRLDDICRVKDVTMAAGVPITLKIGGCEAITDLALGKMVGVGGIVAPMVESAFAMKKFVGAAKAVFSADELADMHLLINTETHTAAKNYDDMLAAPEFDELDGLAIGRKDFAMSMGLALSNVDDEAVVQPVRELIRKTKAKRKDFLCVVGGFAGASTIRTLAGIEGLDEFETRKLVFSAAALSRPTAIEGMRRGFEFERLWFENKAAYYNGIAASDDGYLKRIKGTVEKL